MRRFFFYSTKRFWLMLPRETVQKSGNKATKPKVAKDRRKSATKLDERIITPLVLVSKETWEKHINIKRIYAGRKCGLKQISQPKRKPNDERKETLIS